jgi:hypothetical protein
VVRSSARPASTATANAIPQVKLTSETARRAHVVSRAARLDSRRSRNRSAATPAASETVFPIVPAQRSSGDPDPRNRKGRISRSESHCPSRRRRNRKTPVATQRWRRSIATRNAP